MSPHHPNTTATHYEFISHTGVEDASTKQKLKTVRSHVMRNYLHRQQRQSGRLSKSAVGEQRQSKQRARSTRSASQDTNASTSPSTTNNSKNQFAFGIVGSVDAGSDVPSSTTDHRSALEYVPRPDVVSCLAQLYSNCVMRDKQAGFVQPSFDTLNAKGETMRTVQETLEICGSNAPETVLFAIGILAYGCAANHEWNEALGHVEALKRLIDAQGGMQNIDFELQKMLTCSSFFVGAELLLPPQFPLPLYFNPMPFNLAFQDEAQIRAWRTVKRFPKNNAFVFDIVLRLHQLGLAVSQEWADKVDKDALSNLYFEALHSVMLVQLEEPWQEKLPSGMQGQEATIMFKVWAAGLPIFVSAAARQSKSHQDNSTPRYYHGPIFGRMQAILDGDGGYHAWPRGRLLEPILVTLVYAIEACVQDDPWRVWCVDTIRKVADILKLKSAREFRRTLDYFPGTEMFHDLVDSVWAELTHASVSSTSSGASPVFVHQ